MKKTSIYSKYKKLQKYSVLDNYLYAVKTNLFHSVYNTWMSVLTIATYACLIPAIGISEMSADRFVYNIILLPAIMATLAALADVVIVTKIANNKIYDLFVIYEKEEDINSFIKNIRKYYKVICIVGVSLYILGAGVISVIVGLCMFKEDLTHPTFFYLTTMIIAIVIGILWNVSSFCRMDRINYPMLLNCTDSESKEKTDKKRKFYLLYIQIITEAIGCIITLSSILIYYCFSYSANYSSENHNVFYFLCFTLVCFYAKQIYQWEFSKNNKNQVIYPTRNLFTD